MELLYRQKFNLLRGIDYRMWRDSVKVYVTGVCGQLGFDVVNEALARGYDVIGSDILPESKLVDAEYIPLDITDVYAVKAVIEELRPDVIVHCAAWTAVDAAESPENQEKVHRINVDGTRNLAEAAKVVDAKMVYISTDYVFDGQGTQIWYRVVRPCRTL